MRLVLHPGIDRSHAFGKGKVKLAEVGSITDAQCVDVLVVAGNKVIGPETVGELQHGLFSFPPFVFIPFAGFQKVVDQLTVVVGEAPEIVGEIECLVDAIQSG
jgi:cysteine sulfinate desulfinase/cysteine desulfurase-like protein